MPKEERRARDGRAGESAREGALTLDRAESENHGRDLFLSHATPAKPWVRRLADRVERETWNGRPLTVWVDEGEVRPGHSLVGEVNGGLEQSRYIGLVMTPAYFHSKSGWTEAEWQAAIYPDPAGRAGRVIPLLVEDCPAVPALLRHLDYIDFRDERDFEASVAKLLRVLREEPIRPRIVRGQEVTGSGHVAPQTLVVERASVTGQPDPVSEELPCNLLVASSIPERVCSAPIARTLGQGDRLFPTFPTKTELKQIIADAQRAAGLDRTFMPAFLRHEDRILTFHDLSLADGPLGPVIEQGSPSFESLSSFLDDDDRRRLLVNLLNMTVDRHAHRLGLVKDEKERFLFPPEEGGDRIVRWRRGARPRTVTKRYARDDGSIRYWRHIAARLPIMHLGGRFFIRVDPTWVLTRDGTAESVLSGPRVGATVMRWTGPERNRNILYHVMFWAHVLGQGQDPIRMRAGDQRLVFDPNPASIALEAGIEGDQANLEAQLVYVPESEDEPDWGTDDALHGDEERAEGEDDDE